MKIGWTEKGLNSLILEAFTLHLQKQNFLLANGKHTNRFSEICL